MKTNLLHLDRCLKRRENQLQVHIFKTMCFIYSDLALIFFLQLQILHVWSVLTMLTVLYLFTMFMSLYGVVML